MKGDYLLMPAGAWKRLSSIHGKKIVAQGKTTDRTFRPRDLAAATNEITGYLSEQYAVAGTVGPFVSE